MDEIGDAIAVERSQMKLQTKATYCYFCLERYPSRLLAKSISRWVYCDQLR